MTAHRLVVVWRVTQEYAAPAVAMEQQRYGT
jgi:hypothetical protein